MEPRPPALNLLYGRRTRAVKAFLGMLLLLAAVAGPAAVDEDAALVKGREAAGMLNETLRGRLKAAVRDSSPAEALPRCVYQAQALAAEVEKKLNVRVKRTSLDLRNPRNAPDDFERELLVRLAALQKEGNLPEEVLEAGRIGGREVYRYARPIVAEAFCVTCHGGPRDIPPEVRRILQDRYPDDKATGWKAGDLRGVVSVVVPAD
jgi:hypothetical protein